MVNVVDGIFRPVEFPGICCPFSFELVMVVGLEGAVSGTLVSSRSTHCVSMVEEVSVCGRGVNQAGCFTLSKVLYFILAHFVLLCDRVCDTVGSKPSFQQCKLGEVSSQTDGTKAPLVCRQGRALVANALNTF